MYQGVVFLPPGAHSRNEDVMSRYPEVTIYRTKKKNWCLKIADAEKAVANGKLVTLKPAVIIRTEEPNIVKLRDPELVKALDEWIERAGANNRIQKMPSAAQQRKMGEVAKKVMEAKKKAIEEIGVTEEDIKETETFEQFLRKSKKTPKIISGTRGL
jgi:uncharacterized protein (DUF362 family)